MTQVMANQTVASVDPSDDAFNPKPRPLRVRTYYGKAFASARYVALIKGQGKVNFDPQVHSAEKRSTCIEFAVDTLDEQNVPFALSRSVLSWEDEWTKVTLPSLKALGVTGVSGLNERYVAMEFAPTGRTYTNRDGQEKQATGMKFLKLFANEDECRAAYLADASAQSESGGNGFNQPVAQQPRLATDPARDVALGFLKTLCQIHKNNPAGLEAAINSMPQIAAYFKIDSPETQAFVREAQGIGANN